MNSEKEYFQTIFEEILPELNSGKMTIQPYQELVNEKENPPLLNVAGQKVKICFIAGGNKFDTILIPPATEVNIQINPKCIYNFFENNFESISDTNVLATFKTLNKPAIVYEPERNIIFLLFNLQRLVFRLAALEHEFGRSDKKGRFLAAYLNDKSNWKYPILETIGNLIREKIGLSSQIGKHGIVLTHDVDRVGIEPLLELKNIFYKKTFNYSYFTGKGDQLFQKIIELAKIDNFHKIKSLWFLLAGTYSLRRYGNRYNINSSKSKKLISEIKNNQHNIGLHTSYYAAFNSDSILSEKGRLAKLSGQTIRFIRNHYLRFDIQKSIPNIEDCGLILDSTIGFPDKNGFRAALARPFYLWNHMANRTSNVLELPLLFMDSVNGNDLAASWDDILRILTWIKKIKGCGAFLFHPCFITAGEEKQEFYLNFIQECSRMDIPFVSADELLLDCLSKKN